MSEMPSEHRVINPEWEALEGKPHLVPLNCVPDQYKVIKVGTDLPQDLAMNVREELEGLITKHKLIITKRSFVAQDWWQISVANASIIPVHKQTARAHEVERAIRALVEAIEQYTLKQAQE